MDGSMTMRIKAYWSTRTVLASAVILASIRSMTALDNGLGLTPPMGWSSWNVYAGGVNETKILRTIDAMAALSQFGYEYVNIDDNWMEPTRDANGNLQVRRDKFPRGIKFLADYAHSKGLKLGIYSAHGSRTCEGNAGSGPDHWSQDANLFASWGIDYLKLDSCGGYPANYTSVQEQYREYAAMRDALNATGRPIYYSICEIGHVAQTPVVINSPSSCGKQGAYTSLEWVNNHLDVRGLANSVLIEWVNNNNNFCVEGQPSEKSQLIVSQCASGSPTQQFRIEDDGSIRHLGSASECLDVFNCDTTNGTSVEIWECHPQGIAECGYKNQQFNITDSQIVNVNSGTCLTVSTSGTLTIQACQGSPSQKFSIANGQIEASSGGCLTIPATNASHCCKSGWVSQIDSQQDLTLNALSGPGSWNDNDMLSVGCNGPNTTGTPGTPCSGYQSMLEQRGQFALWCMQASPLILGHDVTSMGDEVRAIITNKDMIALNQDVLGHRAEIAYQSDGYNRTLTIFVKKLASTTAPRAASLFNRGEVTASMELTRTQMGFDAGTCSCVDLKDLDAGKIIASKVTGEVLLTQMIEAHQVLTVLASCC